MAKKNYHGLTGHEYWERMPHESAKAYQAFSTYRDMGPRRSQKKTAEQIGKCARLMAGWASKFSWIERASAYDARVEQEMAESDEVLRKGMLRRHTEFCMALQSLLAKRLETLKPEEITFGQLIYGLDVVQRLERLSRGLPDAEVAGTISRIHCA